MERRRIKRRKRTPAKRTKNGRISELHDLAKLVRVMWSIVVGAVLMAAGLIVVGGGIVRVVLLSG